MKKTVKRPRNLPKTKPALPWQRDDVSDQEFSAGFKQAHERPETVKPAIEDAEVRCKTLEAKWRETSDQLAGVTLQRNEAWRELRVVKNQVSTLTKELEEWRLIKAVLLKGNSNPA